MATCHRTASGNWHDENWDTVPGAADDADLNGYSVTLDSANVTVNSISSSTAGASLTIDGPTLTVSNIIDVGDNITLTIASGTVVCADLTTSPSAGTRVLITGGSLTVGQISNSAGSTPAIEMSGGNLTVINGGGTGPLLRMYGGTASIGGQLDLQNCSMQCIDLNSGTLNFNNATVLNLNHQVLYQLGGTVSGQITRGDSGTRTNYLCYVGAGTISNLTIACSVGSSDMYPVIMIFGTAAASSLTLSGTIDDGAMTSFLDYRSPNSSSIILDLTVGVGTCGIYQTDGGLTITGSAYIAQGGALVYRMDTAGSLYIQASLNVHILGVICYSEVAGDTGVHYNPPSQPNVLTIYSTGMPVALEEADYPEARNIRSGVTARHGSIIGTMTSGGGLRTHLEHIFG